MTHRIVFVAALLAALPAFAGGFAVEAQGARSAGMAGACVAQAGDATALFCNPGALALLPKKKGGAAGLMGSEFKDSLYQGLPPGIGAGTAAQQARPRTIVPHVFATVPLGQNGVFGTGFYHPFRMQTDWEAPNQFAGRFTATSSKIEAYDISPAFALKLGDSFGIGAAGIYRTSTLSSARRLATTSNGAQQEIASLTMKSDSRHSIGWTAGMLIRGGTKLALGASYRSKTKSNPTGVGRLTQILTGNTQLDQLVTATFPFNQDLLVNTTSEFPSQAIAGLALTPSEALLLELDVERTGWKDVHDIAFVFPSAHVLDTTYALSFEDAMTYRGGFRFRFPTGPQLRLGYAQSKTPLPDAAVGAFFPDSDRTTITGGVGLDWIDVAVGVTTYKQRIVSTSTTGLNGNYRAKSWFAVMTISK